MIRLGKYFARIHAENIDSRELDALEIIYVHECFCILEVCDASSYFDAMEHLVVGLVKEIITCDLVSGRWCYA